ESLTPTGDKTSKAYKIVNPDIILIDNHATTATATLGLPNTDQYLANAYVIAKRLGAEYNIPVYPITSIGDALADIQKDYKYESMVDGRPNPLDVSIIGHGDGGGDIGMGCGKLGRVDYTDVNGSYNVMDTIGGGKQQFIDGVKGMVSYLFLSSCQMANGLTAG